MENYIENVGIITHKTKRLDCKTGDMVFVVQKKFNKIYVGHIVAFNPTKKFMTIMLKHNGKVFRTGFSEFKKSVFLTMEEAENKLNEYNNNVCE